MVAANPGDVVDPLENGIVAREWQRGIVAKTAETGDGNSGKTPGNRRWDEQADPELFVDIAGVLQLLRQIVGMAPLASVTRPVTCPKVWANDGNADASNKLKPRIQANVLRMKSPLLSFLGSGVAKVQLGTLIGANSFQRRADVSTRKLKIEGQDRIRRC